MFRRLVPYFLILIFSLVYFHPLFLRGLIPIPADIITGLYYPWLNSGNRPVKNPLMSDIVSIIYQWRLLAVNSIKNFEFPWWNPHYFFGMPLFANFQNSLFNFTNIIFFLGLGQAQSWGLMIYFQFLFSLITPYLFFRSLKLSSLSSITGGIVFSMSLFSTVWLEYGVHNYVAAFLPLSLYFIEKFSHQHRIQFLVMFSLSLSAQIFGGYPQYSIFTFIFSFFYILLLHRRLLFQTFPFFIFAILISLPLLLPGLELLRLSIHNIDTTALTSGGGYLPTQNVATLASPNFWGNPATRDYFGAGFYDNNAFYPGVFALVAFLYFLLNIRRNNSREKLFLFVVPLSLLLATQNPLSVFLKENFGLIFGKGGLSTRIFLLSNLSFSFLTASFVHRAPNTRRPFFVILLWLLSLILVSLILKSSHYQIAVKNTLYVLPVLAAAYICSRPRFRPLLLIVVFSETCYLGWKYLPFSNPRDLFPITPIIEFLQKNSQHYRVATFDTIPENMWLPYGLSTPDGYDTLVPLANYQQLSLIQSGVLALSTRRAQKLTDFSSPLINSASIKYVLKLSTGSTAVPTEFDPKHFKVAFAEGKVLALENQDVLPRARLTPDCPDSNITFVQDRTSFIQLSTQSSCPGQLILADSHYPGWHVTIDNQPVPILKAEYNYRAIDLPAGQHSVIFSYQPSYLIPSLVISLGTLGLLVFLLIHEK